MRLGATGMMSVVIPVAFRRLDARPSPIPWPAQHATFIVLLMCVCGWEEASMSVLASVFTLATIGHMDMANERQIVAVLLRYATAIDQRDWPLFAECFTDDVEADYGAIGSWHGRGEIVEFMRLGHELIGPTLHRLSNFVILGDDSQATATSYVDALLMRCDPAEPPRQAHGVYHDRLVRAADGWKIRSRRFVSIWMTPLVR